MKMLLTSLAGIAALLLSAGARAAVTIVSQRGTSPPATMSIDGLHMRMDNPARNEKVSVVLIDAGTKRLVIIDERNKTYMEITPEDRQRIRDQAEAMRAQMGERMKNMPPEQRKKMEQAMGPLGGAPGARKPHDWKFEPMGSKRTVNGFACEMYRISDAGKVKDEVCVSPWSAGLVKREDFAGLAKFGEEMSEEMGQGAAESRDGGLFMRLDKAPGIPISRTSIQADGTRREEEQVQSIKRGSLPASLFVVPAGFTKKESPLGARMAPGGRHGAPVPR
jgi:Domain of unknown function (DUF4412)